MTSVLGISAYYHDAAAALIVDGEIVVAAEEERFSRRKHDSSLPMNAMAFCLNALWSGGDASEVEIDWPANADLDAVVFYDKPLTSFERVMETVFSEHLHGRKLFTSAMPTWIKTKLWIPLQVEKALRSLGVASPPKLHFAEHHMSHAASAFYPSGFKEAAVVTIDGVGEWATTSVCVGSGSNLEPLEQIEYPHSLGLLYSAATSYCGFRVNSGEYKLMGLAPYGAPRFAEAIKSNLIEISADGSFALNTELFGFSRAETMITAQWNELFGGPPRVPESGIDKRIADVAASFQVVLEEAVVNLTRSARRKTGLKKLTMAGGVALNCVANRRIAMESGFDEVWIQPASTDAGGALGAALSLYWGTLASDRSPLTPDSMNGSLLGPRFSDEEIEDYLDDIGAVAVSGNRETIDRQVARLLADGKIVAMFRGRMEFGPRALGNRSILADPRSATAQKELNLRTKMRESFRPFAPSVLTEKADEYFDLGSNSSPYMLMVADVVERHRVHDLPETAGVVDQVNQVRSSIPAVTHVDYSARVQTVSADRHPDFHGLISAFDELTGCPVLINTSFNVRGQPIVCTPADAYECFVSTGIDYLVLGNHLLERTEQPDATELTLDPSSLVLD